MITKRRPTHPGLVFNEDVLKPLGITITEASKHLGVSRKTLSELVNGRVALSPDMAIRIGKATDTTPESWLQMQGKLDFFDSRPERIQDQFIKGGIKQEYRGIRQRRVHQTGGTGT